LSAQGYSAPDVGAYIYIIEGEQVIALSHIQGFGKRCAGAQDQREGKAQCTAKRSAKSAPYADLRVLLTIREV